MRREISSSDQPSELRPLAVMVESMQRDIKLLLEGHQGLDRRLGAVEQRLGGVEHALLELSTEVRAGRGRLDAHLAQAQTT